MSFHGRRWIVNINERMKEDSPDWEIKELFSYRNSYHKVRFPIKVKAYGRPISVIKRLLDYGYGSRIFYPGDKTAVHLIEYCLKKRYWSPFEIMSAPVARGLYGDLKQ